MTKKMCDRCGRECVNGVYQIPGSVVLSWDAWKAYKLTRGWVGGVIEAYMLDLCRPCKAQLEGWWRSQV